MIDDNYDQSNKEIFIKKSVGIRKKWRKYDQFHKIDNIILSEKSEKQVDLTSDKETDDEEYSFGDKKDF